MTRRVRVPELLSVLGIAARRTGAKWQAPCPSPTHDDADPSWGIVDDPPARTHGSHHCHGCGFGGGPWELAAAVWGTTPREAGERLRKLNVAGPPLPSKLPRIVARPPRAPFRLPEGVVVPGPDDPWPDPPRRYLESRGVFRKQCDRWGLGYAWWGTCERRVVCPVYTNGELLTYSARAWSKDLHRYDSGKRSDGAEPDRALYGEPLWDLSLDTVTIAEGCWSVLSLERGGAPNPTGLLGSELTASRALQLSRWPRILVASDPDAAGAKLWRAVVAMLGGGGRDIRRVQLPASPDDIKNPRDLAIIFGVYSHA